MTDEAARELVAAFLQTLETVERQNTVIRALLTAHRAGRHPDDDVIWQYGEQCDVVEERLAKLRAMLAALSREF